MYIKEITTRNNKTKKEYIKHALVESIRTEDGPRQRTVMQLGVLQLKRELWPLLIAELEKRISGQLEFKFSQVSIPAEVVKSANRVMKNFSIRNSRKIENKPLNSKQYVTVDLSEAATSTNRSFGAEFVAHSTWNELKLPEKLKKLDFSPREASIAEAIVAGRLIEPGSELAAFEWINNYSSIGELTETELNNVSLSSLYRVGDKLLENKDELEKHLFDIEAKLHPGREMLYLFDLTNFYFEGQCLGNSIAAYGKSKEKRNDCPLVSLGLIIDSSGFPVASEVFEGNIGEPNTLIEILNKMKYFDNYLPGMFPTLAMDRGIATKDNIKLLTGKNLPYILITRGPRNADYLTSFENYKTDPEFEIINRKNKEIYVKKVKNIESGTVEILCVSQGKKEKENAMRKRWLEHANNDLASLQRSIVKGSIKLREKVDRKIGRLEERFSRLSKYFTIEIIDDESRVGYVKALKYSQNAMFDIECDEMINPLDGTYVIETVHKDKSAVEIWELYMTLTRVEEAFRCMKSDLGTRPIFHQIERRTKGHLFISILAYHLLINIEYKMSRGGDTRRWSNIRKTLKTHQRTTVIITDNKQMIHHIRVTSQAEPDHSDIYSILKIKPGKKLKRYIVAKRL